MAIEPCGFGSTDFGVEGFGYALDKITVEAESNIGIRGRFFSVVKPAPSSAVVRLVRIKNVSQGTVVLNRLANIPKNLRSAPRILRIPARQTVEIPIDAYDPEQIRALRRELRIIL